MIKMKDSIPLNDIKNTDEFIFEFVNRQRARNSNSSTVKINKISDTLYEVQSYTDKDILYGVVATPNGWMCECVDFNFNFPRFKNKGVSRSYECKHIIKLKEYLSNGLEEP